jgi:hypothetical protein
MIKLLSHVKINSVMLDRFSQLMFNWTDTKERFGKSKEELVTLSDQVSTRLLNNPVPEDVRSDEDEIKTLIDFLNSQGHTEVGKELGEHIKSKFGNANFGGHNWRPVPLVCRTLLEVLK